MAARAIYIRCSAVRVDVRTWARAAITWLQLCKMSRPHARLSGPHPGCDVASLRMLITKAIEATAGVAEDLADGGTKYADHIATIGTQVRGMAQAEHDVGLIVQAVSEAKTEDVAYTNSDRSEPPPLLGDTFESHLTSLREDDQFDVSLYPKVVDFEERVKAAMEDAADESGDEEGDGELMDTQDDEDLVVEQVKKSLNCPITRKLLEDPVTSDKCKHSFSHAAIIQHIRNSRRQPRCPVCNGPLSEEDLKHDEQLQKKVRREHRKKGRGNRK